MNIEVTQQTFDKLFYSVEHPVKTEKVEIAYADYWYNEELDQRAKRVFNHISEVWQYYLIDINA